MDLDDKVCLCFHVTRRKLVNFDRINQPKVPSQLSECGSAGLSSMPSQRRADTPTPLPRICPTVLRAICSAKCV